MDATKLELAYDEIARLRERVRELEAQQDDLLPEQIPQAELLGLAEKEEDPARQEEEEALPGEPHRPELARLTNENGPATPKDEEETSRLTLLTRQELELEERSDTELHGHEQQLAILQQGKELARDIYEAKLDKQQEGIKLLQGRLAAVRLLLRDVLSRWPVGGRAKRRWSR